MVCKKLFEKLFNNLSLEQLTALKTLLKYFKLHYKKLT